MKSLLLSIILTLISLSSTACINEFYATTADGEENEIHINEASYLFTKFNLNFNLELIESKLIKLRDKLITDNDYKLKSDYAVLLLKAGKVKEGKKILSSLVKFYPNEYAINANYGTALELTGEIDSALFYIKKGIELNPESHKGSEWVHVRILETKIKLRDNPDYLENNSVLNLTNAELNSEEVTKHIFYQARERFPFSPHPDAIFSSVLTDLAKSVANNKSTYLAYLIARENAIFFDRNSEVSQRDADNYMELSEKNNENLEKMLFFELDDFTNSFHDDNNPNNHIINWDELPLAFEINEPEEIIEVLIPDEKANSQNQEIKTEKSSNQFLLVYLISIAICLLSFIIIKSRSSSK